jgi:hypothetical protein
MVDHGHSIVDMNIFINDFMDINVRYINLGNVDAMGAIVAMAIVYFSGCQGNP